jgi:hypothetical protein
MNASHSIPSSSNASPLRFRMIRFAFVGLLAVAASCSNGDDDTDSASGSIETSDNGYCMDYDEMCTNDSLGNVKLEACEEKCTNGVIVAASSVRDSICWKTVCSLELGMCETFSSDAANEEYQAAIKQCAMRHGWYMPLPGEE